MLPATGTGNHVIHFQMTLTIPSFHNLMFYKHALQSFERSEFFFVCFLQYSLMHHLYNLIRLLPPIHTHYVTAFCAIARKRMNIKL